MRGVGVASGAGGEDIGCEACVVSHLRPTDFSAILASRSGAPVASDAGGPRWQSRRRAPSSPCAGPRLLGGKLPDADGSGVCESSVTDSCGSEVYGAGAAAIGRPREVESRGRSHGEEDKAGTQLGRQEGTGRCARGLDVAGARLVRAARWLARTGTARPPEAGAVLLGGVPLAGTSRRRGAWPGLRTADTRGARETVTKPGRIIESHARQCKMRSSRFAVDLLVLARTRVVNWDVKLAMEWFSRVEIEYSGERDYELGERRRVFRSD